MSSADLIPFLKEQGYQNLRVLADGTIVGTQDLMFTRALFVDLDRHGFGSRYCYEDRGLADAAAMLMTSGDEPPIKGYVAQRGRVIGERRE